MGSTVLWLLLLFVVATIFALSNVTPVTVNFWQWPVYTGPLALVIAGAGVCGALLTYLGSLGHHARQARQIRSLRESSRASDDLQARGRVPRPPAVPEETRRPY